jgi:hypothetical protein
LNDQGGRLVSVVVANADDLKRPARDDQIVSPGSQLRMVVLGSEAPPARRGVDAFIVPS